MVLCITATATSEWQQETTSLLHLLLPTMVQGMAQSLAMSESRNSAIKHYAEAVPAVCANSDVVTLPLSRP